MNEEEMNQEDCLTDETVEEIQEIIAENNDEMVDDEDNKILELYNLQTFKISRDRAFGYVLNVFEAYGENQLDILSQYYRVTQIEKNDEIKPRKMNDSRVLIERGRRYDLDEYRSNAFAVKNFSATELVSKLFYTEEKNEGTMECSVILKKMTENLAEGSSLLIANPSPIFLEHWFTHYYKKYSVVFAVINEDKKGLLQTLYSKQFEEKSKKSKRYAHFVNLDELYRNKTGFKLLNYDVGIFFVRDIANTGSVKKDVNGVNLSRYSLKDFFNMLKGFLSHCKKTSFLYGPKSLSTNDSFWDVLDMNKMKLLNYYKCDNEISVPNRGLYEIVPKGKTLDDVPILLFLTEKKESGKKWKCFVCDRGLRVPYQNFKSAKLDVHNLIRWAETRKKKEKLENRMIERRVKSDIFEFSPEIKFSCSIEREKGKPKNFVFNYKVKGENIIKGKNCDRVKRSVNLFNNDVKMALQMIPFDEKVENFIRDNIIKWYEKNSDKDLSLKTIWFLIRPRLLGNRRYDDEKAKFLFGPAGVELSNLTNKNADASMLLSCMDKAFSRKEDSALIAYWNTLHEVFKSATMLGYLTDNPLPEILSQVTSRQTDRERQLANALVKKYLHQSEIDKLIKKCIEKVNIHDMSAFRYMESYAHLMCALRLYTGISIRECCALKWKDIKESDYGFYTLNVTKRVRDVDGEEAILAYVEVDELAKRRTIPLVYPIDEMLKRTKEMICKLHSVTEESLQNMPVFLCDIANDYTKAPSYSEASKSCREILKYILDDELILILPSSGKDEEDSKEKEKIRNLRKYHGDILNSNFKYHAKVEMCLDLGELAYVLGIKPTETFDRHYCDYENDFLLLKMYVKMRNWSLKHLKGVKKKDWNKTYSVNKKLLKKDGHYTNAAINNSFVVEKGKKVNISIDSNYGYKGEIIFYAKR